MKKKIMIMGSISCIAIFILGNYISFYLSSCTILTIDKSKIESHLKEYKLPIEQSVHLPIFYQTKNILPLDSSSLCFNQVPQGITLYDEQIVFTTYCSSDTHNSAIYILNNNTYKRIELFDKSHLGGITYDSFHNCFWVCLDNARIGKIDKSNLFLKNNLEKEDIEIFHIQELNSASYITYYDNCLYVGEFSQLTGKLCVFPFSKSGLINSETKDSLWGEIQLISPIATVETPSKVQGITFDEQSVYMSRSFGRRFHSEILTFKKKNYFDDYYLDEAESKKEVSPLLEELICVDDSLYLLFESASKKYQATTIQPIDSVIKIKKQNIRNTPE